MNTMAATKLKTAIIRKPEAALVGFEVINVHGWILTRQMPLWHPATATEQTVLAIAKILQNSLFAGNGMKQTGKRTTLVAQRPNHCFVIGPFVSP